MRTQRTKVRIQGGQQLLENPTQLGLLFTREQSAFVGATQEMAHFVKRSTRRANEPLMVRGRCTAIPFRDICANAVSRANKLIAHGVSLEQAPRNYNWPNSVRELLRQTVDPKIIEREA